MRPWLCRIIVLMTWRVIFREKKRGRLRDRHCVVVSFFVFFFFFFFFFISQTIAMLDNSFDDLESDFLGKKGEITR